MNKRYMNGTYEQVQARMNKDIEREKNLERHRQEIVKAKREDIERLNLTIWGTVTFRRAKSLFRAKKKIKDFFKYENKPVQIFYEKYFECYAYFEECVKGAGYHIHLLIAGIDSSFCSILKAKCRKEFGQSKFEPYDHTKKDYPASRYVAEKYADNPDNLKLFRINSNFRKFRKTGNN